MTKYFLNYIWKNGIPYGIQPIGKAGDLAYKIPMDPYRKRISIEKCCCGQFDQVIYDSAVFDFRHLKPMEQTAWQKVIVSESESASVAEIYNQDDRLVVIETYQFDKGRCRSCVARSPHGLVVSIQRMFYTALGDPFDGVVLWDNNEHPVMLKRYACDPASGEFTDVLEEVWDAASMPMVTSPLMAH